MQLLHSRRRNKVVLGATRLLLPQTRAATYDMINPAASSKLHQQGKATVCATALQWLPQGPIGCER